LEEVVVVIVDEVEEVLVEVAERTMTRNGCR